MLCFVCLTMKPVGEPDAGNPHVRFDEAKHGVSVRLLVCGQPQPYYPSPRAMASPFGKVLEMVETPVSLDPVRLSGLAQRAGDELLNNILPFWLALEDHDH